MAVLLVAAVLVRMGVMLLDSSIVMELQDYDVSIHLIFFKDISVLVL
jgi:hypothetical protein